MAQIRDLRPFDIVDNFKADMVRSVGSNRAVAHMLPGGRTSSVPQVRKLVAAFKGSPVFRFVYDPIRGTAQLTLDLCGHTTDTHHYIQAMTDFMDAAGFGLTVEDTYDGWQMTCGEHSVRGDRFGALHAVMKREGADWVVTALNHG